MLTVSSYSLLENPVNFAVQVGVCSTRVSVSCRVPAGHVEKCPRFPEGTAVGCSSQPYGTEGFFLSVSLATLLSL